MTAGYAGEDRPGNSKGGRHPPPPPTQGWSQFPPSSRDRCEWPPPEFTIHTAFMPLALDSVTFTGLFQLPGHINPAQMPPPLGSLPWLNPLLLRMTLSFPYTPTSHCQKSVSCSHFCPGMWWAAWGPCFLRAEVTPACRCYPTTSGLGESRGSERRHDLPRVSQLLETALAGHRHSCGIFHTKSAPGTFSNKLAVALPQVSPPLFLF